MRRDGPGLGAILGASRGAVSDTPGDTGLIQPCVPCLVHDRGEDEGT